VLPFLEVCVPEHPDLPPIAAEPLSVILVTQDGEAHLDAVASAWLAYLAGLNREHELLIVDDGSRDRTAEIAAELARKHAQVKLLRHATPQGEGAALRTAAAEAHHPLLFYTLCDPRYQPADLNRLLVEPQPRGDDLPPAPLIDLVHLTTGYHAGWPVPVAWRALGFLWRVVCWIILSAAPARMPGWLGWRLHLARVPVRICFGVRNRDVTCPFRLLRRDILGRMALQSSGPFVHAEILAKAAFLQLLVSEDMPLGDREHPVVPRELPGGLRQFFRELWHLFRHPQFGSAKRQEPPALTAGG
jgi:glycosyltransferase involved in cell wall biosynthesis